MLVILRKKKNLLRYILVFIILAGFLKTIREQNSNFEDDLSGQNQISNNDYNSQLRLLKNGQNMQKMKTWRDVNILCVVSTCTKKVQQLATYVNKTWASLCNKTLFVSDEKNDTFPTIKGTVSFCPLSPYQ